MRKIKLQMQLSVDGFVAEPNGEQDWMVWNWDDVLKHYVAELCDSVDTMLLGRVTYQGMSGYWPAAATNPESTQEEIDFATWMNTMPKIVFSTTLLDVEWSNSRLAVGDITEEMNKLKQLPGKDIIVYGGAGMVSTLIQLGFIDEYHLFVNPVVLGEGMPIFREVGERRRLKLVKTTVSNTGIVVLCYQPQ